MVQKIYKCEMCGKHYHTMSAATQCERTPMRGVEGISVGDVVLSSYPASSWWEGSMDWCEWVNHEHRFLNGYYARWVVVAIIPDGRDHKWRYILHSPSNIMGRDTLAWTSGDHYPMTLERKATPDELAFAEDAYAERSNEVILL